MTRRLPPFAIALTALAAGALNVLAFAPFGFWPLQIALLALLFRLTLRGVSVKRSLYIGWAYGYGWSVCGVYWLYISMHRYGDMPAWMAALAVGLLGLLLGGFSALAFGAAAWLRQRRSASATVSLLLIFPSMWALSEWLRGWVFTGFPWAVSGYAHGAGPLAGFAPLVGVYGLGWLAALLAGCIALLPEKKRLQWPLVPVVLLLIAGAGLKTIRWTEPAGRPMSVRLLQGNVAQDMKFEAATLERTLAQYDGMIRAARADLIATPETAMPVLLQQLPQDYLQRLVQFSRQSDSHIVVGVPISDGPGQYANSVVGLAPQPTGDTTVPYRYYRYDKHHLVPFGEFIPTGFHWFVDMMRIPLGDFTRGAALQPPFAVNDQWILPDICYEDLFGEEIAGQLAAAHFAGAPQATVLLNVSNIGWFGDSLALPQHLQISQMRALETGRPMLRATNTGTTTVIDHDGAIVAQLPPFTAGVLTASVQGYRGMTPYILAGNSLVVGLALSALGLAWLLTRKKLR